MKVKIKKIQSTAVIPSYSKSGDAGMDLVCTSKHYDHQTNILTISFGLQLEIPEGYVGLLFPRSSIYKKTAILTNSVGVIDSGYRGEIMAKFVAEDEKQFSLGERCAQLIILPYPQIEFEEVDTLSTSERGEGGYGSTNK